MKKGPKISAQKSARVDHVNIEGLPEILTMEEASSYLRLPIKTLRRLSLLSRFPATKIGGSWRIRRDALEEFLYRPIVLTPKFTRQSRDMDT